MDRRNIRPEMNNNDIKAKARDFWTAKDLLNMGSVGVQPLSEPMSICSDQPKKQSFDRFTGKLKGKLLSYLSIADKFRLQCLSGDTRRTIFAEQKKLVIVSHWVRPNDSKDTLFLNMCNEVRASRLNQMAIEDILKRLTNLTDITIKGRDVYGNRIFCLLADYCPRLESLTFVIDKKDKFYFPSGRIESFGKQCGHKLKTLDLVATDQNETIKCLLSFTPNIRIIKVYDIEVILTEPYVWNRMKKDNCEVGPKLPRLRLADLWSFTVDQLAQFTEEYDKTEAKLQLHYSLNAIQSLDIQSVPNFKRVQVFKLKDTEPFDDTKLSPILYRMAYDCRELRELHVKVPVVDHDLLVRLGDLRRLSTLEIFNYKTTKLQPHSWCFLADMDNLRNLILNVDMLCDNHLVQICQYLEKLESISVLTSGGISDRGIGYIASLNNLTSVRIIADINRSHVYYQISDRSVQQFFQRLVRYRIRRIEFLKYQDNLSQPFNITYGSIDYMAQLAIAYPKVNYYFTSYVNCDNQYQFDLAIRSNPLPKNLKVVRQTKAINV